MKTKKHGDLKSVKECVRWKEDETREEELFGSLAILLAWLCHGTKLILPSLTDPHTHTEDDHPADWPTPIRTKTVYDWLAEA